MPLAIPSQLIQTSFTHITANTTTNSTTYVTLLSSTLVTGVSYLEIYFTAECASTSGVNTPEINFQILIDGVVQIGTILQIQAGYANPTAMMYRSGLMTAGSHTVIIQWKTSTGTVGVLLASFGNACLLIKEVTV